jgi:hypothetical protein
LKGGDAVRDFLRGFEVRIADRAELINFLSGNGVKLWGRGGNSRGVRVSESENRIFERE